HLVHGLRCFGGALRCRASAGPSTTSAHLAARSRRCVLRHDRAARAALHRSACEGEMRTTRLLLALLVGAPACTTGSSVALGTDRPGPGSDDSTSGAPVSAPPASGPSARPRILLTPERAWALERAVKGNAPGWRATHRQCDELLAKPTRGGYE